VRSTSSLVLPWFRRVWTSGLGGAVLALTAAILLWKSNVLSLGRLLGGLESIGPLPFVLGVFGAIGVISLQSLRWWVVVRPVARVRFHHALMAMLVGGFLNTAFPARAGDLARVQYLSERTQVSRATLLGTELVDFWIDKSGWIAAFVLLLPTGIPPVWMLHAFILFATLSALLVSIAWLLRHRIRATAGGEGWLGRIALGVISSGPRRLLAVALGLAALPWLWEALVIGSVAWAAGVRVGWLQAFAVLTAFNVALVVPTPGNVGANEAASSAAFVSFGVPLDRSLALAIVYHGSQLLPSIIAGGALLILQQVAPARMARAFAGISPRLPAPSSPKAEP
jgi:uncharacterized membrane protein YbhN (UPF0104 family)